MKIVLDTNVLISGLLSPYQAPGEIVRMVASGALSVCYDARILAEYRDVLLRPKFGFEKRHIDDLLEQIQICGHSTSSKPLAKALPDAADEAFLEVTIASGAAHLITGNLKHFPHIKHSGIQIVSPAKFIQIFKPIDN